ncbi:hypothetical protein AVEN_141789-1, partial [Araneus ventricosus]
MVSIANFLRLTRNFPCHASGVPRLVNESRCDSSSAEAGVLVVITGHGPTPPEGGTYYHRRE